MSDGFDAMLAALRRLGNLPEDAAKRVAPLLEAELRRTAAAGTAPDGTPWPSKKDGGQAFEGVGEHITAKAIGTTVRATLTGHAVYGHFGGGRNPRRPILPDPGAVPPGLARAILQGADEAFAEAVR